MDKRSLHDRIREHNLHVERIREQISQRVEEIQSAREASGQIRPRVFSTVPKNRPPSSIPPRPR